MGFEHSPPHIYIYIYAHLGSCVVESCVCALQSLCSLILWVLVAECVFAHLIVMENPSASNNFKRRSVEQLKGTCYCYVLYFAMKPQFSSSVHLTILISCYLKSHSYIFFCKYFMFHSVLFGFQIFGVGSVLFGCKYREPMKTILPYG